MSLEVISELRNDSELWQQAAQPELRPPGAASVADEGLVKIQHGVGDQHPSSEFGLVEVRWSGRGPGLEQFLGINWCLAESSQQLVQSVFESLQIHFRGGSASDAAEQLRLPVTSLGLVLQSTGGEQLGTFQKLLIIQRGQCLQRRVRH